jgi:hypothetical protein
LKFSFKVYTGRKRAPSKTAATNKRQSRELQAAEDFMIVYTSSDSAVRKVGYINKVCLTPYRGTATSAWKPIKTASGQNKEIELNSRELCVKVLFTLTPAGKLPGYVKAHMQPS